MLIFSESYTNSSKEEEDIVLDTIYQFESILKQTQPSLSEDVHKQSVLAVLIGKLANLHLKHQVESNENTIFEIPLDVNFFSYFSLKKKFIYLFI